MFFLTYLHAKHNEDNAQKNKVVVDDDGVVTVVDEPIPGQAYFDVSVKSCNTNDKDL